MKHPGVPHHHHHPHPGHHSSSGLKTTMQASRRAMKLHQAWARQAAARARGAARGMAARRAAVANRALLLSKLKSLQRGRVDALRRELELAVGRPLDCHPHAYANGAKALYFETNWTGADGLARVVFLCHTALPGSRQPAAAFLWTGADLEPIDFARESFAAATSRGRMFIFAANVTFADGRSYAVRPATFDEVEGGPLGLWGFATAGRYRGKPFALGRAGMGTFVDAAHRALLVVRPWRFDAAQRSWIWAGRSSELVEGRLKLVAEALLDEDRAATVEYFMPPAKPGSDVAAIRCAAADDWGDPIGVVDPKARPLHGIVRRQGRLFFFARPNHLDQQKRAVFAIRTADNGDGASVFSVPFAEGDGEEVIIELAANHRDAAGQTWFVQAPNARDPEGRPVVFVPLEAA